MSETEYSRSSVRWVLREDRDDGRFERFCASIFTAVDGVEYVTTSRSYDKGRDARPLTFGSPRGNCVIQASVQTNKDPLIKAMSDLDKLIPLGHLKQVRFCFTQELSESKRDEICKAASRKSPGTQFYADGLTQFVDLAVQFRRQFREHYGPDLWALKQWLQEDTTAPDEKLSVMRVALTTVLSHDLAGLRSELTRNLVLTALVTSRPLSLREVAGRISVALSINASIRAEWLLLGVRELQGLGHIKVDGEHIELTLQGVQELEARADRGSTRLFDGREAVRKTIKAMAKVELSKPEFDAIWEVIRADMASMFLHHGLHIVREVAEIAGVKTATPEAPTLEQDLRQMAAHVARTVEDPKRGTAVAGAIIHVFSRHDTPCFRWLSELCVVYISLCSLGLEPKVAEQIAARVERWDVLLDTHIALSLLSVGDPSHGYVSSVLRGWQQMRGKLKAPLPVIEEVLRHAHAAKSKYYKWWDQYRLARKFGEDVNPASLVEERENVFVLGFLAASPHHLDAQHFKTYIRNFSGQHEEDTDALRRLLTMKHGVEILDDSVVDPQLMERVCQDLKQEWAERGYYADMFAKEASRRCDCDTRVAALLIHLRSTSREMDRYPVLVSASTKVCRVVEKHRQPSDLRSAVISLRAMSLALALAPGTGISLSCLQEALFENRFARHLPPIPEIKRRLFRGFRDGHVELMESPLLADAFDEAIMDD